MRISIFVILILLNGFFISCRYSIVKINLEEIEQLIEDGDSSAKNCKRIKEKTNKFIGICRLCILICLIVTGFMINDTCRFIFYKYSIDDNSMKILITIIMIILVIILEEIIGFIIPKFRAIRNPRKVLTRNSSLLRIISFIMNPLFFIIDKISSLMKNILGYNNLKDKDLEDLDKEAIILLEDKRQNTNSNTDRLMDNIFRFENKQIREVLIPRTDMTCIDIDDDEKYIFNLIVEEGYTRYPVCEKNNKDDLLGFIHIRDLYNQKLIEGKINLRKIIRPITYVSESELTSKVLEKLRKYKVQMAIVVDEYGGTSGMITIEDIIEELVGDIQDEFDVDEQTDIEKIDEDSYIVQGTTAIKDINRILSIKIEKEGFDSIGGWVSYMLDTDIKENQSINFEGYKFKVLKLDKFRVVNIEIKKIKS